MEWFILPSVVCSTFISSYMMAYLLIADNNRSSPLATSVPHTSPRRSDMNAARPTEGVRQRNLDGRGYESSTPRRENGPNRLLEERRSYMHGSAEHSWAESLRQPNFDEQEYEYQRRPEERRMYSGAGHQRQGNMYEPAERILRENSDEDEPYDDYPPAPAKRTGDRRPMRRRAGQTHREYHDMEVDDYPEEAPLPSKFSSPGRPSLNPFYSQPAPSPPFPTPTTAQYASKSEPQFAPPQSFDEFTDSAWGNK